MENAESAGFGNLWTALMPATDLAGDYPDARGFLSRVRALLTTDVAVGLRDKYGTCEGEGSGLPAG